MVMLDGLALQRSSRARLGLGGFDRWRRSSRLGSTAVLSGADSILSIACAAISGRFEEFAGAGRSTISALRFAASLQRAGLFPVPFGRAPRPPPAFVSDFLKELYQGFRIFSKKLLAQKSSERPCRRPGQAWPPARTPFFLNASSMASNGAVETVAQTFRYATLPITTTGKRATSAKARPVAREATCRRLPTWRARPAFRCRRFRMS